MKLKAVFVAALFITATFATPAGASLHNGSAAYGGYVATFTGAFGFNEGDTTDFANVTTTWTAPTITCPATGYRDLLVWTGLGSIPNHNPAGTGDGEAVGVQSHCASGTLTNSVWVCMLDSTTGDCDVTALSVTIVAGHQFKATAEAPNTNHPTKYKFIVHDDTANAGDNQLVSCPHTCNHTLAYSVITNYTSQGPPNFGEIVISDAQATNDQAETYRLNDTNAPWPTLRDYSWHDGFDISHECAHVDPESPPPNGWQFAYIQGGCDPL